MDDIESPEHHFLAFGWSKTADPSDLTTELPEEGAGAGWCVYFIHTGEEFDDYPKLGHSDSGITVGTNVFDGGFVGSRLWSIAKPSSPETCPALPVGSVASFGPLTTEDGDTAFTPVPANAAGGSPSSYVVAADSPFISGDAELMAWHVTGAGAGAELVEDGNIAVAPFAVPANVPQPGTAEVLDSLDTRLTNAVSAHDPDAGQQAVWTQHTVDGPGGRSVVRWYELLPATQTVRQEGEISDPEHFVFNGAISPSTQGNSAAIDFNRGGAALFPEMAARSRDAAMPLGAMGNEVLLGSSAGPAVDFSCGGAGDPCRWGDYAGASPDPVVPGVVWGSNQGVAAPSGESSRWTTRNFALIVDETAPVAPTISGTDPASPADENDPKVKGEAEAGSTVRVYTSDDCSGAVAAKGSAAAFASPGLAISVADNETVPLTATATDAVGNTSVCSAASSYTEETPEPPDPEPDPDPDPEPEPDADPGPELGRAVPARVVLARGRLALVRLRCLGQGPCHGALRFVTRVRVGKKVAARPGRGRFRRVVIGGSRFAIPAGKVRIVRARLTRRGAVLVRRSGRRGRPVWLAGRGVVNRVVRLRKAPQRRGMRGPRRDRRAVAPR